MSFGSSSTDTHSKTVQDPYKPTIPYVQSYLQKAAGVGGLDITPDQQAAFSALKTNAAAGNPFTPQIADAAHGALTYDNSGQSSTLGDAYKTLQTNLGDYTSGKFLDVANNPQLKAALDVAANDAQDRINRMFAGSGRDLSGYNQQTTARGITQAEAPILLDQFNKQQQNQLAANGQVFNAAQGTASGQSALDAQKFATQAGGVPLTKEALDAQNYAGNQILNLDQQIQQLPYQNLSLYGSLLLPAAGLGGTSNTKGSSSSSGFGISLSDERMKEDIAPVGEMADGQTVYRYKYKGDPDERIHIGLMAQEVEDEHPDAVVDLGGGLKGVDYEKATRSAVAAMVRSKRKAN